MNITGFKIKNFRTITTELSISINNHLTIVGPNNSGKSNTLLAFYQFFTGFGNQHNYAHELDLPFGNDNVQTSLTCSFKCNPEIAFDRKILGDIRKLQSMLIETRQEPSNSFSLNLVFRRSSPVYQLFPGIKQDPKKKAEYASIHRQVVSEILKHFKCHRIPSDKSVERVYLDHINPLVKKEIGKAIAPYAEKIKDSILSLSQSMNESLATAGINDAKITFDYPSGALENLVSAFELQVEDTSKSSIYSKGMGLQASVLFSALEWVTKQHKENHVIWLIEEPETYMHPALAHKTSTVLNRLAQSSTLIKTTHSLGFIPSTAKNVIGVEFNRQEKRTSFTEYKTILEATSGIRTSLGVRFSDYFALSDVNIFVEGETDVDYLYAAIKTYEKAYNRKLLMSELGVKIISFGGCTGLAGFLRANYEFIFKEVVAISLFDGDEAGTKATKDLRGFFGTKCGFLPDRDYTLIPRGGEIESLFPDNWIWDVKENHSSWLEDFEFDAAKAITAIKVSDNHKRSYMNLMLEYMRNPHHEFHPSKFDVILETLDQHIMKAYARVFPELKLASGVDNGATLSTAVNGG